MRRRCLHIPDHIAVIQDGNRRFARLHGLDVAEGHRLGAETTERVLDWAQEIGVRHVTIYCFSTENFRRDDDEVQDLFSLFMEKFAAMAEDERVHRNRIRVRMVGDRTLLPPDLRQTIEHLEEATSGYRGFHLNIAIAYGGRNEIVHAAQGLLSEVRAGLRAPSSIGVDEVEEQITSGMQIPPVDLIIRTGDERRTSNFLPWLANGNECAVYFCAPYWPVFRKIDLLRAVRVYDQRVRLGV